jgi:pyridoxal phosphate enzyme (YggS family)
LNSIDLRANLRQVLERIAAACDRAGRNREEVRLVAVSKTFSPERIRQVMDCGQFLFGENRVQEALAKIPEVGAGARWHMIGHLQRNKARQAIGRFELIHSVDGSKLADELDRRAGAAGLVQPILIEVNLAGESSKSGIDEAGLWPLLEAIQPLAHLEPQGLMTVPPRVTQAEESRPWFVRLRDLAREARRRTGLPLRELSMGMTDDFEVAVEEGATLVRVGRAIFGPRN